MGKYFCIGKWVVIGDGCKQSYTSGNITQVRNLTKFNYTEAYTYKILIKLCPPIEWSLISFQRFYRAYNIL